MATTEIGAGAAHELDELYRAHAAEVYRYAYATLGNTADAEDVTQTTFVNALRALERGEHPRKPVNWLITIAHNLIRQRFRQQQARPREVELDRDVATLEADGDDPSIDDLVRALQRIPPAQREALVLRELEGRSYKEITSILGVSLTALETLIFRARRSLAEELENLVTCDRAELALSRQEDRRLARKERRRLVAHLEECASCARVAAVAMKRRRAFKGLALLPLPLSLTLFKGAPSASAAIGLPTIGAGAATGTAVGLGAGGVTAKLAIGLAAVAVAGGAGYEGTKALHQPSTPARPAKAAPTPIVAAAKPPGLAREKPSAGRLTPAASKPERVEPTRAKGQAQGRSSAAPGQTKLKPHAKKPKQAAPPAKQAGRRRANPPAATARAPLPSRHPAAARPPDRASPRSGRPARP